MMYHPDKWLLVKINGTDPHYRIFGSWYGGYMGGDSYRMNSGITGVDEVGDFYVFKGSSGSLYSCQKEMYGAHMYGMSVLNRLVENSQQKMEIIYDLPKDLLRMDWII